MLFDKLSPTTPDFISKIQSQLDIINGNILYLTHEIDQIKVLVKQSRHNDILQKQVDDFYNNDDEPSHQTDSDEQ